MLPLFSVSRQNKQVELSTQKTSALFVSRFLFFVGGRPLLPLLICGVLLAYQQALYSRSSNVIPLQCAIAECIGQASSSVFHGGTRHSPLSSRARLRECDNDFDELSMGSLLMGYSLECCQVAFTNSFSATTTTTTTSLAHTNIMSCAQCPARFSSLNQSTGLAFVLRSAFNTAMTLATPPPPPWASHTCNGLLGDGHQTRRPLHRQRRHRAAR